MHTKETLKDTGEKKKNTYKNIIPIIRTWNVTTINDGTTNGNYGGDGYIWNITADKRIAKRTKGHGEITING